MSEQNTPTYPGGLDAVLTQMEGRRDPFVYGPDEALPPLDTDLEALTKILVDPSAPETGGSGTTYARKYRDLAKEFADAPALLMLHGLLIANLRRRDQPAHTPALFQRLWAEKADFLLAHLDARWLVSAMTTFGDHGATEVQRSLGQSLSVLFGMMKLYETERLFSGAPPDQAFAWKRRSAKTLALEMDAYAIVGGGLDVNMLGRLWQDAAQDPVIAPLTRHLLNLLINDDKTVFRRLRTMRTRREKKIAAKSSQTAPTSAKTNIALVPPARVITDPAMLNWGTVSLVKAPLPQILRFAAHHLDLGAHRVHIYLDAPEPETLAALSAHPRIAVTACDAAFWDAQKKGRMEAHQNRQSWVATLAYHATDCDWLAHIDVDEFLLPPAPLSDLLARAPANCAAIRMPPAEQLAGPGPEQFKLTTTTAGQPPSVLEDIYPTFGLHLPDGFVSHTEGKIIARTGLGHIRFNLHALSYRRAPASNVIPLAGLYLGHAHAPDWDTFRSHLDFRMTQGSYRKAAADDFKFRDIVEFLLDSEGEPGLRALFNEVCTATPHLTQSLAAHHMLLDRPLDLDAKVLRHFGTLPKG
ncbi:glycosyltransferase family 2 protein [Thalassovita taeanensis]|uniref:Glycosyl transferase family 2 n=1 Tax=Thalassovita taeanensis TaxID=657014 RepID=A0A1H9FRA3_9RHOB|nr:glycosyltransferase family 2 protein [Thalassovita taeanensis]SEQ40269.1 Glycosyl transferase family 2 [Thalassovita taeanensis]